MSRRRRLWLLSFQQVCLYKVDETVFFINVLLTMLKKEAKRALEQAFSGALMPNKGSRVEQRAKRARSRRGSWKFNIFYIHSLYLSTEREQATPSYLNQGILF